MPSEPNELYNAAMGAIITDHRMVGQTLISCLNMPLTVIDEDIQNDIKLPGSKSQLIPTL